MDKKFDIVSNFIIVAKWRKSRLHRKCLYCKFSSHLPSTPCSAGIWFCDAKMKMINPDIHRPFCKCFTLDEG